MLCLGHCHTVSRHNYYGLGIGHHLNDVFGTDFLDGTFGFFGFTAGSVTKASNQDMCDTSVHGTVEKNNCAVC
jgi:hypothetical protein